MFAMRLSFDMLTRVGGEAAPAPAGVARGSRTRHYLPPTSAAQRFALE
jgi:hypothetical protein